MWHSNKNGEISRKPGDTPTIFGLKGLVMIAVLLLVVAPVAARKSARRTPKNSWKCSKNRLKGKAASQHPHKLQQPELQQPAPSAKRK